MAYRARRFRKRPVRRFRRRQPRTRLMRRLLQRNPIFTESLLVGQIQPSSPSGTVAGMLKVKFADLPQAGSYSALYRRFKILHTTWTLIPRYTGADIGTAIYNGSVVGSATVGGWGAGYFAYSIDDTPGMNLPTSLNDVLNANGSRVVQGLRKIVIRNKPKALLSSYTGVLGSAVTFKTNPWLNTDNPTNTSGGTAIDHYGVRFYFNQTVITTGAPAAYYAYDIFCKVRFMLADPA